MSNIWKLILDTILMALVFLVIGLVVLFLFFAFKDDVQAMMIEPPEVCALCDQEPRTVPCLLNISTGDLGALAGTTLPGKFQYIGVLGAMGGWDSDAKTGHITIPDEDPAILALAFCRSCRWTIMRNPPSCYFLADLSEPQVPRLYPIRDDPLTIQGWTITPEEGETGTALTITPAE
ncbi:MAG: hypothetical protein IKB65_01395 [Ruminiclostridium sp.]|nr:hypothetical protein [Ruminiclostridium sp.]